MSPKYPLRGRYGVYIAFGACSIFFVLSSLLLLETVQALASGAAAWTSFLERMRSPAYLLYHVLALAGFLFTGWRFFLKLFAKSQPPRIGPLKPPPPAAFPPMLVGAWLAASAAVLVVAWGIAP